MQSAALRYLLDTSIVSEFVRHPEGVVTRRIVAVGESRVCTSIVVACELRFGALKKGSPRMWQRIAEVLEMLPVLPLESGADRHYAEIREALEKAGRPIGSNDLLIAAHARSRDLRLVTRNVDEFSRVPGLEVARWPAEPPREKP